MGFTSVLGSLLLVVATADGLNDCFSGDRCAPGTSTLSLRRCGLTDADLPDLADCFDSVGRRNIDVLDLDNNRFTTLPAGIFAGFTSLLDLKLDSNRLTTLTADVLSGAPELVELCLASNRLTTLEEGTFAGNQYLESLLLDDNQITSLPEGLFQDTPNLIDLELADNLLTELPAGLFRGLVYIQDLKIVSNQLERFPTDIFDDLTSLRFLLLFGNELTTLQAGLFDGLDSLRTLGLRGNDGLQCIPAIGNSVNFNPRGLADSTCECPAFPTCDENGDPCECQAGSDGYSCAGSSSRAFECDSSVPPSPAPAPALVDARERTTVTVDATAFDERTSSCGAGGCTPENTRDNDLAASSRWSCRGGLVDGDEECCIEYYFDEPQDIVGVNIAFHRGTTRTRTLDLFDNGDFNSQVESSGTTNGFQLFPVGTDETSDFKICLEEGTSDRVWLSITEVQILVN